MFTVFARGIERLVLRPQWAIVKESDMSDQGQVRQHQDEIVIVMRVAAIDGGIAERDCGPVLRQALIKGDCVVGLPEGHVAKLGEDELLAFAGLR